MAIVKGMKVFNFSVEVEGAEFTALYSGTAIYETLSENGKREFLIHPNGVEITKAERLSDDLNRWETFTPTGETLENIKRELIPVIEIDLFDSHYLCDTFTTFKS